jgi:hypothetical protein
MMVNASAMVVPSGISISFSRNPADAAKMPVSLTLIFNLVNSFGLFRIKKPQDYVNVYI